MTETWLSAHLYWSGPLDELLRQCVAPVVTRLFRQRRVSQFFFIRYAEGGPHVRLRLKTPAPDHAALVAELRAQFSRFQRCVSQPLSGGSAAGELRVAAYEPETARYGGAGGLLIAEAFFEASSWAVLSLLRTQGPRAEDHRLTTALVLHTGFTAACLPPPLAADWLRHYVEEWLPHDPQAGLARPAEQAYWLAVFAGRGQQYQPALTALVAQHWQRAARGQRSQPVWLDRFFAAARQAAAQYQQALTDPAARLATYASLLHMTNNRLGVPNHDEAFLAYLLGSSLPATDH